MTLEWQKELRNNIRNPEELVKLGVIRGEDLEAIRHIHRNFPFSITPHYAKLIDWQDPHDPLLKFVAPSVAELQEEGLLDVGGEAENTQDEGIQMKYPSTVLILPVPACFSYCRFCFRKRLFNPDVKGDEILKNLEAGLEFIKKHPYLNNVLLTGGDPLMIPTPTLRKFLGGLRQLDHVRIIRLGTRALPFLPSRITSDPELLSLLKEVSGYDRRVYFVNHFSHPKEFVPEVGKAVDALMAAGVVLVNQTAILKGVNDSPETLRRLLNDLADWGITPYYVFQCKFIKGSGHFRVPLYRTCEIFQEATRGANGLAKRAKLIMAHSSGKIEILGVGWIKGERVIYLKYHQARDERLMGRIMTFPLPDGAYWFDDLPGIPAEP